MGIPEQLSAMLFELRGAATPVAKARALARAWRTVRQLSPSDRRRLAREAGFEGAEDLVESLSTRKGGVAPAMLLQILNTLRDDGPRGLTEVMAGLRDPKTRDDTLIRSVDALTDAVAGEASVDKSDDDRETHPSTEQASNPVAAASQAEEFDRERTTDADEISVAVEIAPPAPPPPVPPSETEPTVAPPVFEGPRPEFEAARIAPAPDEDIRGVRIDPDDLVDRLYALPSPATQLRILRKTLPNIAAPDLQDSLRLLDALPTGWPRRRGVVALLKAELPTSNSAALKLIESLERSLDRRWCVRTLISQRRLEGPELEKALDLLESASTLERRRFRAQSLREANRM